MNNRPIRRYSAADVQEFVELFRDSPDMSPEKFSGMEYLAAILRHFESKTEDDIAAEVSAFCRKNPFFPIR
jgi:hypothetical protein